ncbi:ubiquitin-conjugating protein DMA2 KNAG_0I02090 [Huiozyma naganishii CBS 8797]|uniref:RING-type E3 ubiquitin transferase n=1 Tax=Huiozyma naganishii (strain ATCC MYA-139 / BCRC 22969 / CBS 8797 / KCTC 17520 / NBRC 10181 / NCYC 3082 / Yp74L-3) TaxID=1071383 RepID=J7S9B6_HUIN7|nr:hypothetical protein KNAG_0I02090 [Kazachstania naganishii CBS 8797]CCK71994.1 hypothetical protein KNAG_0I02090 [Kazachstania naganishii CBS 8797]
MMLRGQSIVQRVQYTTLDPNGNLVSQGYQPGSEGSCVSTSSSGLSLTSPFPAVEFKDTNRLYTTKHPNEGFLDVELEEVRGSDNALVEVPRFIGRELPLHLTFTNLGCCNGTFFDEGLLPKGEVTKSMVQFIYGPRETQENFQSIPLDTPVGAGSVGPRTPRVNTPDENGMFSIRLTPLFGADEVRNPLYFCPITRLAGPNSQFVICRDSKRVRRALPVVSKEYQPIMFDSVAVSRLHGYIKVDNSGSWYLQDFRSKSGTFLNHNRITPAHTVSKDILLEDGDIIQLGINTPTTGNKKNRYVRMKVELNDSWKHDPVKFGKVLEERMNNLTEDTRHELCSICLEECKLQHRLFFAPCSHCWHSACIQPYMNKDVPLFTCPNCRCIFDLSEDDITEIAEMFQREKGIFLENTNVTVPKIGPSGRRGTV